MPSKLGPHFIGAPGLSDWIDAGPKIYKFDPTGLGASAQVPAGPLVVGKLDQQDAVLGLTDWKALMRQGVTPEAAADLRFSAQQNIYVGANKPRVNRYTANPRVDVWEDDNEVMPDNQAEADWYAEYCIEMMQHYESIGKKRANLSFAVGTPEMSIWPHLLPAVRYARDHGHYIALHEYMGFEADYGVGWKQVDAQRRPTTNVWHGRPDKQYPWGWAALRYRYVWDTVFKPAGVGDVKLVITELGCDSVQSVTPAGKPVGSWKAMGLDAATYAEMLQWYDRQIREDAYVAGATVFTVGSVGVWKDWDIAGTNVELLVQEWIAAEDGVVDPEPPPPPVKHKAIVLKVPQAVTADEWQRAAGYGYEYRHTMTASHDDMLTILRGGNDLSYVKLAWPGRQTDVAAQIEASGYRWEPLFGEDTPGEDTPNPLAGLELGHLFAYRYTTTSLFNSPRDYGAHEGVDLDVVGGAADNKVDVLAAYPGVVDASKDSAGNYGKYVRLRHERNGGVFYTWYCHLDRRYVETGQVVAAGQPLGEVGTTGNVTGEHVHFNLVAPGRGLSGYVIDDVLDPLPYLPSAAARAALPMVTSNKVIDVLTYLMGAHRRQFDMGYAGGTQTTQVLHLSATDWLFVKGENGDYERLGLRTRPESPGNGEEWIFRFEDTSESPSRFYAHYRAAGGEIGAPWFPRHAEVGRWYETTKHVQHYLKAGCVKQNGGTVVDRIRLMGEPRTVTYADSLARVEDVITLEWAGGEQYDFAAGRGNVAFRDPDRRFWFIGDVSGRPDKAYRKPACLSLGW